MNLVLMSSFSPIQGCGSLISARRSAVFAVHSPSTIPEKGNPLGSFRKNGSSIIPISGDSGSFLLSPANGSIGVIGGVSIDSTLKFANKLVKWSSKDGENRHVPFVLCSDPALSEDLRSHERSGLLHSVSRNGHVAKDHSPIVSNLRNKRMFLEKSGVSCIVMPCHVSHSWYDEVGEGSSVPFLHIGECVSKELKQANLKPVEAGSSLRIGLLATNTTLAAGFYQKMLQNEGFEVEVPDKATMEHTVIPAMEALSRKDIEGAQNLLRIALQVLLVRAVSTIIIASDDLQNLLPPDDPLLKKCMNPVDALARSTIKYAQSESHTSDM